MIKDEEKNECITDISESNSQMDSVSMFLNDIKKFPVLTSEQEVNLAKQIEAGNNKAREEMINHNLRLVVYAIKPFIGVSDLDSLDLIQEGTLGLMTAVDRFDYRKGVKFSTYAIPWIKQKVQRYITKQGQSVRVPDYLKQEYFRVKKFVEDYKRDHGVFPDMKTISEETGVTESHVIRGYIQAPKIVSLNMAISIDDDEGSELIDLIAYDDQEDVSEIAMRDVMADSVRDCMKHITQRERRILNKRFGIYGDAMTLDEIGKEEGLTRERIRQIEKSAITKLQRFAKKKLVF